MTSVDKEVYLKTNFKNTKKVIIVDKEIYETMKQENIDLREENKQLSLSVGFLLGEYEKRLTLEEQLAEFKNFYIDQFDVNNALEEELNELKNRKENNIIIPKNVRISSLKQITLEELFSQLSKEDYLDEGEIIESNLIDS